MAESCDGKQLSIEHKLLRRMFPHWKASLDFSLFEVFMLSTCSLIEICLSKRNWIFRLDMRLWRQDFDRCCSDDKPCTVWKVNFFCFILLFSKLFAHLFVLFIFCCEYSWFGTLFRYLFFMRIPFLYYFSVFFYFMFLFYPYS